MTVRTLRVWLRIHTWASLVCTLFLLLVCLTGLPLLFSEEIDHWQNPHAYESLPPDAPRVALDELAAAGSRLYPGEIVTSFFIDDEEPQTYLWMAPSWAAMKADPDIEHFVRFDARTGQVLETSPPPQQQRKDVMEVVLRLHRDLFADLPGELFLGVMAALFVAAVVSGAVIYGPFARRMEFGTIRSGRSTRLKWLDLHNVLGVVTLAWAAVVGATGLMNELSDPLFAIWQRTDVQAMLRPLQGKPYPEGAGLSSVQAALDTAQRALPGMTVTNVVFPGSEDGTPYHYVVWAKGDTPLTGRLFSPALVDAASGELTGIVRMPWYLRALEISRPLHFGDYGGLPLKIIWALLDGITIVVLGSGAYLWFSRRRTLAEGIADGSNLKDVEVVLAAIENVGG